MLAASWLLDVSRLIASRMVFRAQGESPAPLTSRRESCNVVKPNNLILSISRNTFSRPQVGRPARDRVDLTVSLKP